MTRAILFSLLICAGGALLEGLSAGREIKQRLAELRMPRFAVPFWGWIVIGALYYVICFAIACRLFLLPPSPARHLAFALLGSVMLINAAWNYFFFRARNLGQAYWIGWPYSVLAVALFILLLRVDRTAARCLLPYMVYLFYANSWAYRVWKLNPN